MRGNMEAPRWVQVAVYTRFLSICAAFPAIGLSLLQQQTTYDAMQLTVATQQTFL